MFKKIFFFLLLFTFSFLDSSSAHAARIFFEPAGGTYRVGDTVTVTIKVDTQGETVNAVDLNLLYPQVLRIKSVSKSGSAIQLWVKDPGFTGSAVVLSGGVPGGIQGNITLAKVVIEAAAVGDGRFGLGGDSVILLNDGQGTSAQLSLANAQFQVTARAPSASPRVIESSVATPETTKNVNGSNSPKPSKKTDTDRPQGFSILVGTDPRVFSGKHFISFFTTDAESGIDHYELKEGKGGFKFAQSPYLLSDQKLRSVIRVRAYDSAGNYRESAYPGFFGRLWLWIINLFTPAS